MTVIASFLGIQDPRERPAEAREAADNAHAKFTDTRSEFLGILKLWEAYREAHEELTQSKSVSYTHLDVYKRQARYRYAGRWARRRPAWQRPG